MLASSLVYQGHWTKSGSVQATNEVRRNMHWTLSIKQCYKNYVLNTVYWTQCTEHSALNIVYLLNSAENTKNWIYWTMCTDKNSHGFVQCWGAGAGAASSWPLGAGAALKKPEAGAGAAKNLPAPQPCFLALKSENCRDYKKKGAGLGAGAVCITKWNKV